MRVLSAKKQLRRRSRIFYPVGEIISSVITVTGITKPAEPMADNLNWQFLQNSPVEGM